MDSGDGQTFVRNLAQFVRSHEKALANAVQLRRQKDRTGASLSQPTQTSSHPLHRAAPAHSASTISSALVALSLGSLGFKPYNVKAAKLTLTSHHLFYLLSRFEDIGIAVGPLNVRIENLNTETSPANYVSFLRHSQRSQGGNDRDSIHSVTSVRSVISGLSAFWSGISSSSSTTRSEKSQGQLIIDLRYLYSAFTKIPCLRLTPDCRNCLIRGFEEFPFDTAVPLHAFKNLSVLDICDIDFRQFFGWDKLAEQLRSLTLKRANVDDPSDLLTGIVLDDMDKRRRRSSKPQSSPVLAWPVSPSVRLADVTKVNASQASPAFEGRSGLTASPQNECMPASPNPNNSPTRPSSSRQNSSFRHTKCNSTKTWRSGSESSDTSIQLNPLRIGPHQSGSSQNSLLSGTLPGSKWRFLRHLSLADNALTFLSANALSPLTDNLQSLDLSSNLFTEVPDGLANLVGLRALNLSHCMIGTLKSLLRHPLPAITTLNIRANRLDSIVGVEKLLSLERLDLRDNKVTDPSELVRLTSLPDFREVWVVHNPFTKSRSDHRITIFNLFRSIPGRLDDVLIDNSGPTSSERKQLIDRVTEGKPAPVIQNMHSETSISLPDVTCFSQDKIIQDIPHNGSNTAYVNFKLDHPGYTAQATSITSSEAFGSTTTKLKRHRKGSRRSRVVDLAVTKKPSSHDDLQQPLPLLVGQRSQALSPKALAETDLSQEVTLLDRPRSPDQPSDHDEIPLTHSKGLYSTYSNMHEALSGSDSQTTNIKAHRYRQKIEALKQEGGSNWLSTLTGEGCISKKEEDGHNAGILPMRKVIPEVLLVHTSNQGLV